MALPQARIDETRGLTLVTKDGRTREATRYLFTALDALDPDRKYQLATLRAGGEEVASRCLRRTNNYIPRCEFTPLETWFEPLGINELAGDEMQNLVSVGTDAPPDLPPLVNPGQFFRAHQPMMGVPHYPGVDLPLVIEVAGYRGVKEIESLRGIDWESGEAQRIRNEFFPAGSAPIIPFRLIEERIREVGKGELEPIAGEMLLSVDHSRRWALSRIGVEHGLLQTRTKHDHTYSYSRLAPQLLAQLEMEPKDVGTETSHFAKEIVRELIAAQSAVTQQPIGNIDTIVEAAVKAALLAHGVGAPAPVKQYVCDGCEKAFDTPQGLSLHKTRHCAGKPE